jgi:ParB-like chromosome segregation protein Spo0J
MAKGRKSGVDQWQNRIIGEGMEAPDQLLANPQNWRIHGKSQQEALSAVLDRVGWITRVIVNKRTGHVVDGHLRVALAISKNLKEIPVTYVDLSQEEESLILTTMDPIAAMANVDSERLGELLEDLKASDADLDGLLSAIHGDFTIPAGNKPVDEEGMADTKNECPACGFKW